MTNSRQKINPLYRRLIILMLALLSMYIFILIFPHISDLIVVGVVALVLTYVFRPGVEALERLGVSRITAITGFFVITTGLLILLFRYLVPVLIHEIGLMTTKLNEVDFSDLYKKMVDWIDVKIPVIGNFADLDPDRAGEFIEKTKSAIITFLQKSITFAAGAVNFIVLTTIVPFLTFFFLKDGPAFSKKVLERVPNRFFEMTMSLAHSIDFLLGAYIRSILLESMIIWALTWSAFALLGMKFALVLGLLNGMLNMIPFIGPIIAVVPIGIVVAATYTPTVWGLAWVGIILLAAQIIDNIVLKPLLISRSVKVHPAMVLIVVLIGGRLAGAIGMFLAVPVFSVMQVIVIDLYSHLKSYRVI